MPLPSIAGLASPDLPSLQAIAERYLANFPDLHRLARQGAGHVVRQGLGYWRDPDTIWWQRFTHAQSSAHSFTGWEHVGSPVESISLTRLLVCRFSLREQFNADLLGLYGGFYSRAGGEGRYDASNEVRLAPEAVLQALWDVDFQTVYTLAFERFWSARRSDFCVLARARFLASVEQARHEQRLTPTDCRQLLEAAFGRLQLPASLQRLREDRGQLPALGFRSFEVDGWHARNLLRLKLGSGRQILYVVDEAALFAFDDHLGLYDWVLALLHSAGGEQRFINWFVAGETWRAVHTPALQALCARLRAHELRLNAHARAIDGDVFVHLRELLEQQMRADARDLIVSNTELRKREWQAYLEQLTRLVAPAALLGWPLALLGIAAGGASLGLHLDQALNGRSPARRTAGWWGALLDALFLLLDAHLLRAGEVFEAAHPSLGGAPLARRRLLYEAASEVASGPELEEHPLGPLQDGSLERHTSTFWDAHMHADADRLLEVSDVALARQRLLLAQVPRVASGMRSAAGEYLDAFDQPLSVYCDELGFAARHIRQYSHSPQLYNNLLRGLPLEGDLADNVRRIQALADELEQVGASSEVRLYRVGLGGRETSGAYWRAGRIKVGERLLCTDFTSFSENPYLAWEMFNSPQALASGQARFGDDAVVYVLEPGEVDAAVPVALFSELPHEAESLLVPGRVLQVGAVSEVSGAHYRFVQVRLRAVAAEGGRLFDFRTGAAVQRQALVGRVGEVLMGRLFAGV